MSSAILADPATIAAGATGQGPGSATNANAMVALQDAITTGGTTFLDYYYGLQSGLGTATQSTARSQTPADHRQRPVRPAHAASGVSLDEEMTNMIKFQHAYAAAARVLTAMDENLDRLINRPAGSGCDPRRRINQAATHVLADLQRVSASLPADPEQAVERQEIQQAEDDPFGAGRALFLRTRSATSSSTSGTSTRRSGFQDASESAMSSVQDIMQRARELVVQAGNGSLDQTGLNNIAAEIEQLVEAAREAMNGTYAGR